MLQFIENDQTSLAEYVRSIGRGLILFDGRPAAGKTYLAKCVARRLGCPTLDGDTFLLGNGKPFMSQLEFDKLGVAIDNGLAGSPLLLLSSAFARAVADRLKRQPAAVVWIEEVSAEMLDIARECYDDDDISANDAVIGGVERPRLLTEVEEYTVTYNARLSPDRVYLNVVD
ncbi:MAG: ATP-binding protein [Proteobacteria bacterium]|nr:ATP-binding protein [Pseudomonadota bacterium]